MECEGCGRTMRQPYKRQEIIIFGELDDVFNFCFLCVKEGERQEAKIEDDYYLNPNV